jgi:hypothetical protein
MLMPCNSHRHTHLGLGLRDRIRTQIDDGGHFLLPSLSLMNPDEEAD